MLPEPALADSLEGQILLGANEPPVVLQDAGTGAQGVVVRPIPREGYGHPDQGQAMGQSQHGQDMKTLGLVKTFFLGERSAPGGKDRSPLPGGQKQGPAVAG
jgi:hypothetical protein